MFLFAYTPNTYSTQNKKEIMMLQHWQKDSKKGEQPFIIESEHEQTSGILSWDLEANIWEFQYTHTKWIIKDHKLTKIEKEKSTTYPCVGFSSLLQHKMDEWQNLLEKKHEVCNDNVCFLFASYNKKPMIWKYSINPFSLLSVALEDSSNRYYQLDFEVDAIAAESQTNDCIETEIKHCS